MKYLCCACSLHSGPRKLPEFAFHRDRSSLSGYDNYCRQCKTLMRRRQRARRRERAEIEGDANSLVEKREHELSEERARTYWIERGHPVPGEDSMPSIVNEDGDEEDAVSFMRRLMFGNDAFDYRDDHAPFGFHIDRRAD